MAVSPGIRVARKEGINSLLATSFFDSLSFETIDIIIYKSIREAFCMAQVNIHIDDELKFKADALFDELGLSMTTAFTMFIKAAVRQNRIPFELSIDPFYSEKNIKVLRESIRDADLGKLTEHELFEVQS